MRSVQVDFAVPGRSATSVYDTISDFRRYPELAPAVRHVEILTSDGVSSTSAWEVWFRQGVMRWVESDRFDPVGMRIEFTQLEGDAAVFDGSWACTELEGATRLTFSSRLDMGIPSLADALEPIAVRTLVDNITAIVRGLLGDDVQVEGVEVEAPGAASTGPAGIR